MSLSGQSCQIQLILGTKKDKLEVNAPSNPRKNPTQWMCNDNEEITPIVWGRWMLHESCYQPRTTLNLYVHSLARETVLILNSSSSRPSISWALHFIWSEKWEFKSQGEEAVSQAAWNLPSWREEIVLGPWDLDLDFLISSFSDCIDFVVLIMMMFNTFIGWSGMYNGYYIM